MDIWMPLNAYSSYTGNICFWFPYWILLCAYMQGMIYSMAEILFDYEGVHPKTYSLWNSYPSLSSLPSVLARFLFRCFPCQLNWIQKDIGGENCFTVVLGSKCSNSTPNKIFTICNGKYTVSADRNIQVNNTCLKTTRYRESENAYFHFPQNL